MILKLLRSDFGITLVFLMAIAILIVLFDSSPYSKEEISWCKENRPNTLIDICAKEFGY